MDDTVGYCRVSSEGQVRDGHGLESYLARLRRFGLSDDRIFQDVESGGKVDRAGFQQVLKLVRGGTIKKVVVPAFDRFSRLDPIDWEHTMQELRRYGVTLIFLDGGSMSFENPDELYIARLQAIGAAREREKNQWRALQGYKHLRAEGRAVRACFGWIREDGRLRLNHQPYRDSGKTYYQIAREIGERFMGIGEYAGKPEMGNLDRTVGAMNRQYGKERLGAWGKDFPRDITGLRKWLINEVHQGHVVYFPLNPEKKEVAWNSDPNREQLFTERERGIIEDLLKQNSRLKRNRDQIRNPLAGLVYCAGCGSPMTSSKAGDKNHRYMICKGAYPRRGLPKICDRRSAFGVEVEDLDIAAIKALVERAETIALAATEPETEVADSAEMLELRRQAEKLEALNDADLLPVIRSKYGKLEQLREQQKQQANRNIERLQLLIERCSQPKFWDFLELSEKKILYNELIERVEIDKGAISVTLRV